MKYVNNSRTNWTFLLRIDQFVKVAFEGINKMYVFESVQCSTSFFHFSTFSLESQIGVAGLGEKSTDKNFWLANF